MAPKDNNAAAAEIPRFERNGVRSLVCLTALAFAFPILAGETPESGLEALFEAGEFAAFTCSGHFIAGRSVDEILGFEMTEADGTRFTVAGAAPAIDVDLDRQVVSVPFAEGLPPMRSKYRRGLGCSVLPFGAPADRKLPILSKPRPEYGKSDLGWPASDPFEPADRAMPYQKALDRVIDRVFGNDTYGAGVRTIGVIVIHEGKVVAERYRDGFGPHTQYRTWSTAKSLASAVVGVAIRKGVLPEVGAPAIVPEWRVPRDPRAAITLENLLHMASGLDTVVPEDGSDTSAAYFGGIDSSADAASLRLIHEPGSTWHYSNYDTLLLMRSLKAALGDDRAYLDFPYEQLFDRIGMHDTFAETDAYGNYVMSSQVFTTPRDLARFAYLYLTDGVWRGQRLLPEGWVDYSCTPTSAAAPDGVLYGAQWWMSDIEVRGVGEPQTVRVCTTDGHRGQHAAIVRPHDIVIVRTGLDSAPNIDQFRFFEDVVNAIVN